MVEPFSIAGLAGAGLMALAQAVATDKAKDITQDRVNAFRRMLARAQEQGKLPANHHLERGTTRACLIATQTCIYEMLEEQRKDAHSAGIFQDTIFPENSFQEPHTSNENCLNGLKVELERLIRELEYVENRRQRGHQHKKLLRALNDGALTLQNGLSDSETYQTSSLPSQVDRFGGKVLRLINSPFSKLSAGLSPKKAKLKDIRKLRGNFLPSLQNAVIEQVLNLGGWNPQARRDELQEELCTFFFGEDELWAQYFSLCYLDEIRIDKELNALVVLLRLENLDESLENVSADVKAIKENLKELNAYRQSMFTELDQKIDQYGQESLEAAKVANKVLIEVRERFKLDEKVAFYSFKGVKNAQSKDNHRPFYFGGEADEFIGREDILTRLHNDFLTLSGNFDRFKWLAICGPAGSGKSRLALHILNSYSSRWRLSGFVNRKFLENVDFHLKELCQITAPTLFVIDYADISPSACCSFLEQCAAVSGSAPYPIRVIVLIRRTQDHFFKLVRERKNNGAAQDSQLKFDLPEGEDQRSRALFLTGLTEQETATLMRRRITHTAQSLSVPVPNLESGDIGDQTLITMLRRYDQTLRPLLAIIIAYVFTADAASLDEKSGESQEEARLRLFWNYLGRQFSQRWTVVPDNRQVSSSEDNFRFDTHLNFLLLSTMCRGLTDEEWAYLLENNDLKNETRSILPGSRDHIKSDMSNLLDQDNLLAALSGHVRRPNGPYPIFEPDLLGESLVLLALDEKGQDICLSSDTLARRQSHLRNLAWNAGVEGAMFFSVLTAQDFPKKSAELNWLLPDVMPEGAEAESITLFRNLVLSAIEPFWTRAAEVSDVEYIEKLIKGFRPPKSASEDVAISYLTGVTDLISWLSFIINKGIIPGNDENVQRVRDKYQGQKLVTSEDFNKQSSEKREDEFSSNTKLSSNFPETNKDPSDRQSVFEFRSDDETVEAAMVLLLQFYEHSLPLAFSEKLPLELRKKHADAMHYVLTSVLWDNRAKSAKFGYAFDGLSDAELEIRRNLAKECERLVSSKNVSADTLVVVVSLLQGYIFAENGTDPSRGDKVFEKIETYVTQDKFSSPLAISIILSFLGNHTYNRTLYWIGKLKEEPNIDTPDLSNIDTLAKLLFSQITPDNLPSEKRTRRIVNSWCDLGRRLAYYYKHTGRDTRKIVVDYLSTFEHLAKSIQLPITGHIINLLNSYAEQLIEDGEGIDAFIESLAPLIERAGYDPHSTNNQNWTNLKYHLHTLVQCNPQKWETVEGILEKAETQIGNRATQDLADTIINILPDFDFTKAKTDWLATWVMHDNHRDLESDQRQKLTATFISQRLLISPQSQVYDDLETLWTESGTQNDIEKRTNVILCFKQVLLWYGYDVDSNKVWRERLMGLIGKNSEHFAGQTNSPDQDYIAAIIDCVSAFTAMEIEMGLSVDDWLDAGGLL